MKIRALIGAWMIMLSTGLVSVAGSVPANAAASCWGKGCVDLIAETMGCTADAFALTGWGYPQEYEYTLFYSKACHSAWAEAVDYTGSPMKGGSPFPSILQVWHSPAGGGLEAPMSDRFDFESTASRIYTPMVDWDDSVKICLNKSGDPDEDPYSDPHGGVGTVGACSSWR